MNTTETAPRPTSPRREENAPMLTPAQTTAQTVQAIQQNPQETTTMTSPVPSRRPLLTVRALAVLMLAAFVGAIAALLTFAATHDLPTAVLAGLGAAGTVALEHDALVE